MIRLALPESLETERLRLQRLRYEDAEEIFYTYASKPEATRFVSFPTHQTIQDSRAFLRYAIPAWNAGKEYTYAIRLKDSARLIGTIGFINENGKVQFGYIRSPLNWGRGYATEVCRATLAILKQQHDIFRIWTVVDVENIASARVLEKCGLKREATLHGWMKFPNQNSEVKDCIMFYLPL